MEVTVYTTDKDVAIPLSHPTSVATASSAGRPYVSVTSAYYVFVTDIVVNNNADPLFEKN